MVASWQAAHGETIGDRRDCEFGMRLAQVLKLPSMARVTLVHIAQPESEVRGVHIVDFPNPAPWVRAGQVLLTTGYAWPRDDHLQRAMVHQLADCRLTALGLAVPGFFERMPQAVLDVAIERGLTLFEIPWIDSFARIVEEIHGAIIAEQYPGRETFGLDIGAILALGVVRLLQRQARLDNRPEQSVSTGVLTTQETVRD
jgi:purine catabolism regulator